MGLGEPMAHYIFQDISYKIPHKSQQTHSKPNCTKRFQTLPALFLSVGGVKEWDWAGPWPMALRLHTEEKQAWPGADNLPIYENCTTLYKTSLYQNKMYRAVPNSTKTNCTELYHIVLNLPAPNQTVQLLYHIVPNCTKLDTDLGKVGMAWDRLATHLNLHLPDFNPLLVKHSNLTLTLSLSRI